MEICDDPQFFVEGYSRFDVQQGELGDCWLLAAAANLTQDPKLFFRVVCDDNSFEEEYAGIFHFRVSFFRLITAMCRSQDRINLQFFKFNGRKFLKIYQHKIYQIFT